MELSETHPAPAAAPGREGAGTYEQCDHCGALVDQTQRYCVTCGAHLRHAPDPAARYLATLTARARSASAGFRPQATGRRRSHGLGLALVLAIIPLAVGLGVLVGRGSNGGDGKLIAALRAQKPEVITVGGGGAAPAAGAIGAAALKSDFPLQSGYAVELRTLPGRGTDQVSVISAEHAAESKGARAVGLILQSDFRVTPSPPPGTEVIYSGAYRSKAAAEQALAGLPHRFPGASVIRVQAAGSATAGGGRVLATSAYGAAHQIAGSKPSAAQLSAGKQVAQQIQQTQGKSYVGAQRNLPDQISIP